MANNRFDTPEHGRERPARPRDMAWLSEPATWFAATVMGMLIVFIGLAIDAYRHNHGASEESLLSLSNPGHVVAGIGLVMAALGALAGLSVSALKNVDSPSRAIKRFIPVTAGWVAMAAVGIGSFTYIGASGVTVGHTHAHDDVAVAANPAAAGAELGDAGVAQALKDQGIGQEAVQQTDTSKAAQVAGSLTQGASGHAGGAHDHGKQPTFTQLTTMSDADLLPLFPANTITAADLPTMKQQVGQVRVVALRLDTPEKAVAAGYVRTTSDVPFMGEHYLNYDYVRDGLFDPAKPEGLLFSKIDSGSEKLVGVWFLQIPGIGGVKRDVEPVGFAGDLDLWHAHTGLCLVALSGASEGETKEGCAAKGGNFTPDLRWMMHVWVAPETSENPDGIMAYLNNDLYAKQAAVKSSGAPSGTTAQ